MALKRRTPFVVPNIERRTAIQAGRALYKNRERIEYFLRNQKYPVLKIFRAENFPYTFETYLQTMHLDLRYFIDLMNSLVIKKTRLLCFEINNEGLA